MTTDFLNFAGHISPLTPFGLASRTRKQFIDCTRDHIQHYLTDIDVLQDMKERYEAINDYYHADEVLGLINTLRATVDQARAGFTSHTDITKAFERRSA